MRGWNNQKHLQILRDNKRRRHLKNMPPVTNYDTSMTADNIRLNIPDTRTVLAGDVKSCRFLCPHCFKPFTFCYSDMEFNTIGLLIACPHCNKNIYYGVNTEDGKREFIRESSC